jgi:phosphoglucomutase
MAFCHRLNNFTISALKPQTSNVSLSIQPSFTLQSPSSSFKLQNSPLRVRFNSIIRATSSSSSPTTIAEPHGIKVLSLFVFFFFISFDLTLSFFLKINSIPTKPIEGQKTGTSGLRKKVGNCYIHYVMFDKNVHHYISDGLCYD